MGLLLSKVLHYVVFIDDATTNIVRYLFANKHSVRTQTGKWEKGKIRKK